MIRSVLLGILLVVTASAGCSYPAKYTVMNVDNKVAPWKPADPDDLVVDDGSDDDDDDDASSDKDGAEE